MKINLFFSLFFLSFVFVFVFLKKLTIFIDKINQTRVIVHWLQYHKYSLKFLHSKPYLWYKKLILGQEIEVHNLHLFICSILHNLSLHRPSLIPSIIWPILLQLWPRELTALTTCKTSPSKMIKKKTHLPTKFHSMYSCQSFC
jgi:hypothetical protein